MLSGPCVCPKLSCPQTITRAPSSWFCSSAFSLGLNHKEAPGTSDAPLPVSGREGDPGTGSGLLSLLLSLWLWLLVAALSCAHCVNGPARSGGLGFALGLGERCRWESLCAGPQWGLSSTSEGHTCWSVFNMTCWKPRRAVLERQALCGSAGGLQLASSAEWGQCSPHPRFLEEIRGKIVY